MSRTGIILVHACRNYVTQLAQRKKRAYQLGRSRVTIKTVFYCCPEQFPCLELRICNMSSFCECDEAKESY